MIPCQAVTSVLCLHYRPERTGFNMYAEYTKLQLTFLTLQPCLKLGLNLRWSHFFYYKISFLPRSIWFPYIFRLSASQTQEPFQENWTSEIKEFIKNFKSSALSEVQMIIQYTVFPKIMSNTTTNYDFLISIYICNPMP